MSELLINDPVPSFVKEWSRIDHALTEADIAVKDAQDVKRKLTNELGELKLRVQAYMEETGEFQLDRPECKINLRKKADKLVLTDENVVPAKYVKLADPVVDKNLLKKDLVAAAQLNIVIPGAHLEEGGQGLAISWKECA